MIMLTVVSSSVAGGVFAVHPLASEAVGVITFREDLLAAVGLLGATWLVLPAAAAAAPGRLVGAGVCVLAACGAKEVALPYPLCMAAAAWLVPGDEPRRARFARWVLPGAAAVAIYVPLRFLVFVPAWDTGWTGHPGGGGIPALATIASVLARYVGLCVWPGPLSIDHNPAAVSFADPSALLGFACIAGAIAFGAWAGRRAPRAALALAFATAFLLPVCDLLPLANIMAERYCYLPLAGAALGMGLAADALAARVGPRRPALALAGVAVVAALAVRTMARETVFRDDDTLWTHTAATDPGSFRAALGLAKRLEDASLDVGKLRAALEALATAERVRGAPFVGGVHRAAYVAARERLEALVARAATGAGGEAEALAEARAELRIALTRDAGDRAPPWSQEQAVCWRGLGHVWQEHARELDGRLRHLRRELEAITQAIQQRQEAGQDHTLLRARFDAIAAEVEARQPRLDAALVEAERWLEASLPRIPDPIRALAHEGLTVVWGLRGDLDRVEAHTRETLRLLPGRGLAAFNLGNVTRDRALRLEDADARVEGLNRAIEWFLRAQADPESARMGFMNEFGLFSQKQLPNEFPDWDRIFDRWHALAERFPDDRDFRFKLGSELARTHRFAAAEVELRWILARDPSQGDVWLRLYQVCSVARPEGGSGFGKPVEALAILDEAMRVAAEAFRRAAGDPEALVVHQAAVVARVAVGEIQQRDPTRPSALAGLGWAFLGMGLSQTAQPMLADARARDAQAGVRWQLDRDDAAIQAQLAASAAQSRLFQSGTIPQHLAAAAPGVAAARRAAPARRRPAGDRRVRVRRRRGPAGRDRRRRGAARPGWRGRSVRRRGRALPRDDPAGEAPRAGGAPRPRPGDRDLAGAHPRPHRAAPQEGAGGRGGRRPRAGDPGPQAGPDAAPRGGAPSRGARHAAEDLRAPPEACRGGMTTARNRAHGRQRHAIGPFLPGTAVRPAPGPLRDEYPLRHLLRPAQQPFGAAMRIGLQGAVAAYQEGSVGASFDLAALTHRRQPAADLRLVFAGQTHPGRPSTALATMLRWISLVPA